MNLVLIGRGLEKLQEIANDLQSTYQVKIDVIEADFARAGQSIYEAIEAGLDNKDIGILVNNVGVILPHPMYFHEVSFVLTQLLVVLLSRNLSEVSYLITQP